MTGRALVDACRRTSRTSTPTTGASRVAVVDYGCKRSILRRLAGAGAAVTVFPTTSTRTSSRSTTASCSRTAPATPSRSTTRSPSCASCSGACRCSGSASATSCSALATGHETYKLPFGHRGANHPVLERATRPRARHEPEPRLRGRGARRHGGDARVAVRRHGRGPRLPELRARSVQFHPEAGPGPARRVADPRASGSRRCALPRRDDLQSICLIGSGPIVIGQACEFDYAGCQALKVLREDGFRTIVVNSNPATIMTDPGFADRTYLEPLDLEGVADVLGRERPDALLPTMGGQTALNLARELARGGRARRARDRADRRAARRDRARRGPRALQGGGRVVRPAGADLADRHRARTSSRASRCPRSFGRRSRSAATAAASRRRRSELAAPGRARRSRERPIGQVLVEESVRGWDEFELEVIRDRPTTS